MKWYPHWQVNSHPPTGGESNSRLRNFSASRGDQVTQFFLLSILPDAQIWAVFVSLIYWCKNVMVIWCAFTELIECQSTKIKYKPNISNGAALSTQFEFDVFKYSYVTQGSMSSIFFGQKDQTFDFPPTGFNARLVFRKREGTEIFEGGRKPDVIRIVKPPVIYISLIGNHHSNNQTKGFPHVGIWIVSPI